MIVCSATLVPRAFRGPQVLVPIDLWLSSTARRAAVAVSGSMALVGLLCSIGVGVTLFCCAVVSAAGGSADHIYIKNRKGFVAVAVEEGVDIVSDARIKPKQPEQQQL